MGSAELEMMSLRIRTIPLVLAVGLGNGAYAQNSGRDPSLELFFDPSRPAVQQLYLPGTRVLKHLDTVSFHERILTDQELSGGVVYPASDLVATRDRRIDFSTMEAVREGRYGEAGLAHDDERIALVRSFYQRLSPEQGQWARAAMQAATDFVAGRDRHALLRASYAVSLNPVAPGLAGFLKAIETRTGKSGTRIPSGTGLSLLEVKLNLTKELFKAKQYTPMLRICRDVLILKPGDPTALARLGSGYYMLRDYEKAASVWGLALKRETRSGERKSLSSMVALAKRGGRPKPRPEPRKPVIDLALVEALYQKGVLAHAAGDAAASQSAFEKMILLVPEDKRARKALRRLSVEGGL